MLVKNKQQGLLRFSSKLNYKKILSSKNHVHIKHEALHNKLGIPLTIWRMYGMYVNKLLF